MNGMLSPSRKLFRIILGNVRKISFSGQIVSSTAVSTDATSLWTVKIRDLSAIYVKIFQTRQFFSISLYDLSLQKKQRCCYYYVNTDLYI